MILINALGKSKLSIRPVRLVVLRTHRANCKSKLRQIMLNYWYSDSSEKMRAINGKDIFGHLTQLRS